LGVPSEDEDGAELTLRQRIDRLRSAEPLVAIVAAAPPPSGNGAGDPVPADVGLVDEPLSETGEPVAGDEPDPETDEPDQEAVGVVGEGGGAADGGGEGEVGGEGDGGGAADGGGDRGEEGGEGGGEAGDTDEAHDDTDEADEDEDEGTTGEGEPGGAVDVVDVDEDSGAAPLVEAVRALEEAARVEAELAPGAAASVDIDGLSETLAGLQDEVAALRTLVESLATDLRERLEAVHEEVLVLTGKLQPTGTEVVVLPKALEQTADLPPLPDALIDPTGPIEDDGHKPRRRRLLLVVLLVLLGLVIAGLIVVTVVFGWDAVRDEMTDLTSALPVFSTVGSGPPEGVVP
ncbi:MAG: hypothetical protein ACLGI2_06255, partial [Acidimicrobiia bacterium]